MLNGEKMKLRKMNTITASFSRKTGKLSSFFSFFAGFVSAGRAKGSPDGVWFSGVVAPFSLEPEICM